MTRCSLPRSGSTRSGMKQYYYRDTDDLIRGPVTFEQLSAMMVEGLVDPTTPVAEAGGSTWVALGGLLSYGLHAHELHPALWEEEEPPPVCPKCRRTLPLVNGGPGHRCPHCGFRLAPSHGGVLPNFFFVLCKAFTLRGRTTRREFAFFQIVVAALSALLLYLGYVCLSLGLGEQTRGETSLWYGVGIGCFALLLLFWLLMALPQFSLTVRRLHDVNRSGLWVFLHVLFSTLFVLSSAYLVLCLAFLVAKGAEYRFEDLSSEFDHPELIEPPDCYATHAHLWFDRMRNSERAETARRFIETLRPLYDFVDRTKGLEFDRNRELELADTSDGLKMISILGEWKNVPPYGMRTALIVNLTCMTLLPVLSLVLLVLVVSEGQRGANRYGPDHNLPHT